MLKTDRKQEKGSAQIKTKNIGGKGGVVVA
jgi:hypothetical protein